MTVIIVTVAVAWLAIALALSLPDFPARDTLLSATYVVVIFSILVQALTLGRVTRRILKSARKKT